MIWKNTTNAAAPPTITITRRVPFMRPLSQGGGAASPVVTGKITFRSRIVFSGDMRRAVLLTLLSLLAVFAVACGSESAADPTAPSAAADDAPVIAHSKELTTIYFVHAEW